MSSTEPPNGQSDYRSGEQQYPNFSATLDSHKDTTVSLFFLINTAKLTCLIYH